MKKINKILIIIAICVIFVGITIPFTLIDFGGRDTDNGSIQIHIYVNSTIYSSLSSNINQYEQDIIAQGYTVAVFNWSLNNVTELKNHLIEAYSNGLEGAVLIGMLPYAKASYNDTAWNMRRYFSCDYYLMDLDGNWNDVNGNGYYDVGATDNNIEHNNGTADALPEIWIARISPYTISETGFNPITAVNNFFNRTHNLRVGLTYRPHKALLYIDDEWASLSSEWISAFTAYTGSNLTCESDYSYLYYDLTNSLSFLSNISDITHPAFANFELVHVLAHSNGTEQQFGLNAYQYPNYNATDGILTYNDIYMNGPQPLFFNLYSCFSANLMIKNNIATHYLFSGQALNVIGCARSGGMCLYEPFYDSLNEGKIFGEAFKDWFYGPEIILYDHWEEVYGMKMFGDPLLTIYMT
ncbi:MAG: hypothetical protein ACFE91_04090 [Promethearchaeota archaeon]